MKETLLLISQNNCLLPPSILEAMAKQYPVSSLISTNRLCVMRVCVCMYTYTHYMYDCEYSVAMGDILKAAGDFSVQNTLFTKGES